MIHYRRNNIEIKSKPMKIIICLIMIGIALGIYIKDDKFYRDFLILKDKANRLLQQKCLNCIVEGKIKFTGEQKPAGFFRNKNDREYQYNYSYQVNDKFYYDQILVDTRLPKYFTSSNFSYRGEFSERIIIDINNPADSLPLKYAQMIVKGYKPKLSNQRYYSLFCIIVLLCVLFYQLITPTKDKNK